MNKFKNNFNQNLFQTWLYFSIILVLTIIIIGGLTRLTDSGLSITEWELIDGIMPPLSSTEWQIYFNKYKLIPQFQLLYPNMSIDEFKFIYLWEYAHRIIARIFGAIFLFFLIYFYITKQLSKNNLIFLSFVFFLIVIQGLIGWIMVKSGLENAVSVSHYRLALHLLIAFFITTLIYWLVLNFINKTEISIFSLHSKHLIFLFLLLCLFAQITIGAFVSGLDAGKIYQSWPTMNGSFFPDDISLSSLSFDQPSFVQFLHRNLAYLITLLIIFLGYKILIKQKKLLYKNYITLLILTIFQILFGILVLFSNVNIYVASVHQILGILIILTTIRLYFHSLKYYKYL